MIALSWTQTFVINVVLSIVMVDDFRVHFLGGWVRGVVANVRDCDIASRDIVFLFRLKSTRKLMNTLVSLTINAIFIQG